MSNDISNRVQAIEIHLNSLCLQHDELMTMLDCYYLNQNLSKLQNSSHNITDKLDICYLHIKTISSYCICYYMDKMMTILNEEHENVMINLNRRIDHLTNILQQYYETFNEQHMNKRDNEAKYYIITVYDRKIELFSKDVHRMVAEYKNDMEMTQKKLIIKFKDGHYRFKDYQQILKRELLDYYEQINNIQYYICNIRCQMPAFYFVDLHEYTFKRIVTEIEKIEGKVDIYWQYMLKTYLKEQTNNVLYLLIRDTSKLYYQIKAMKETALFYLSRMYAQNDDKFEVNKLEKKIVEDILHLQQLIKVLKDKLAGTSLYVDRG